MNAPRNVLLRTLFALAVALAFVESSPAAPGPAPKWMREDTVETHLTWVALDGALGLADANRGTVRRFDHLLGYDHVQVNDIVFGKDVVWLATGVGLLKWDRKGGFWSKFAVNAALVEVPITKLSLEDDRLCVTITEAAKAERRFEYAQGKWRELQ